MTSISENEMNIRIALCNVRHLHIILNMFISFSEILVTHDVKQNGTVEILEPGVQQSSNPCVES